MSDQPISLKITPAPGKPGKYLAVAVNGVGELHRDMLDLNSAISRKRFVGGVMQKAFKATPADDWPDDARNDLEKQLSQAAAVPPGNPDPPPKATEKAPDDPRIMELDKMPEDIRVEAEKLLLDPQLMKRVHGDIETMGIVGENANRLILYLVGTSAQLSRPLAAIARGASSSGKSFLCEQVSRLIPPEVVLHATSLTANALYYFSSGTLRHRFIVTGERSHRDEHEQADVTLALREMLETGRLAKAIPIKDPDSGRPTTVMIEQDGPIAYCETTTQSRIFEEDANRCLLLNTDEGVEQTERIIAATALAASRTERSDVHHLIDIHHALQRMLPRVDIVVPFAGALGAEYPKGRLEGRRDFRHLLQLVRASALLHFRQRERTEDGCVIADFKDYAIAEKLARGPIGAAASGLGESARKFLKLVRDLKGGNSFTTSDLKLLGGLSLRTIKNRLYELSDAGVVEQTEAPKGSIPAKWRVLELTPEDGCGVLPTLEDVKKLHARMRRPAK